MVQDSAITVHTEYGATTKKEGEETTLLRGSKKKFGTESQISPLIRFAFMSVPIRYKQLYPEPNLEPDLQPDLEPNLEPNLEPQPELQLQPEP